ncbi:unnamed protein product [Arabidopsis thaliana]|uniref:(thale cress) hypothetical protein n=1 Tax=Arabidopsis thaliana TaxID=3702 RepID=A0A7G2EW67_ARATH|nr:unnamed protein product [Arabidopsis thaliana]
MARGESEGESSGSERESSSSSSGNESEPIKGKISEYEKQRLSRIAENKARLDALGISKAAKALLSPSLVSKKRRVKRNSGEEDDDYTPVIADGDGDEDEDEEFLCNSTRKRKNQSSASKRRLSSRKILNTSVFLGEDDDDLDKAIALSLQGSVAGGSRTKNTRSDKEAATMKKKRQGFFFTSSISVLLLLNSLGGCP